jgi:hypothetical protein
MDRTQKKKEMDISCCCCLFSSIYYTEKSHVFEKRSEITVIRRYIEKSGWMDGKKDMDHSDQKNMKKCDKRKKNT